MSQTPVVFVNKLAKCFGKLVAMFEKLIVREIIDAFCTLYVIDHAERTRLSDEAIDFVGILDFEYFRPSKLACEGGLFSVFASFPRREGRQ